MKTSMLGKAQRRALVKRWPEVATRGVADGGGHALFPGDLVRLPADVRLGSGEGFDVPGTVIGFAVGKDGGPSVAVHALARSGGKVDSWRTWIVNGAYCNAIDESVATQMLDRERILPLPSASGDAPVPANQRAVMSTAWMKVMIEGVRTKGGVVIKPGDLVRLPRNVARNRGSQLHAAGTCLGYAIGLDGSPCIVVDAVGENVSTLTRWRTWVVRGAECLVIDAREAWRLESMYTRDGRMRERKRK